MAKPSDWERIERKLEGLSLQGKEKLLARLIQRVRQRERRGACRDWAKLYGLGKGIWNDEDAQDYVNRIREDRV